MFSRIIIVVVLLCNLSCGENESQSQVKTADAHVTQALSLHVSGQTEESISELRKAIELDPAHTQAHRLLAHSLRTMGDDSEESISLFRKAIELDPGHARTYFDLAFTLRTNIGQNSKNVTNEIVAALRKAIELDPNLDDAKQMLERMTTESAPAK